MGAVLLFPYIYIYILDDVVCYIDLTKTHRYLLNLIFFLKMSSYLKINLPTAIACYEELSLGWVF